MFSSLAGVMRLASIVICVVALASFTLFAVNQTDSASRHQQRQLNQETATPTDAEPGGATKPSPQKSSLRKTVDDISDAFTSPFSAVTAGSSSQWVIRGVNLLLVLVIYGFGLGFLARLVRVRL